MDVRQDEDAFRLLHIVDIITAWACNYRQQVLARLMSLDRDRAQIQSLEIGIVGRITPCPAARGESSDAEIVTEEETVNALNRQNSQSPTSSLSTQVTEVTSLIVSQSQPKTR